MGVKVRQIRGHWYLVVHYKGRRWKERAGPTKASALEAAKVFQRRLASGEFEEGRPVEDAPQPFNDFAVRWLRTEVQLPTARGVAGALAPNSARQREECVRLYSDALLRRDGRPEDPRRGGAAVLRALHGARAATLAALIRDRALAPFAGFSSTPRCRSSCRATRCRIGRCSAADDAGQGFAPSNASAC